MLQLSSLWRFVSAQLYTLCLQKRPGSPEWPILIPTGFCFLSYLSFWCLFLPNHQDGSLNPDWDLRLVADPQLAHLQVLGFSSNSLRNPAGLSQSCHFRADVPSLRLYAPQRNLRDRTQDHGADPVMAWFIPDRNCDRIRHQDVPDLRDQQIPSGEQENNHLFSQMHNNLNSSNWISSPVRWRAHSHPDPLIRLLTDSTVKK